MRLDPLKLTVEALVKPLPVTVRVVFKEPTRTSVGETEDKLGAGYVSNTIAEPELLLSAWLVAVTVTRPELGATSGAV